MRASSRHEAGRPAVGLAIIAAIFATALVIRQLPPAAREVMPVTHRALPSRAFHIWSANQRPVAAAGVPAPPSADHTYTAALMAIESTPEISLIFDMDPGDPPTRPEGPPRRDDVQTLSATSLMPVTPLMSAAAEPVETGIDGSPFTTVFTKTGSALRLAFVKTGLGIKAAASGTAGVFVPNP